MFHPLPSPPEDQLIAAMSALIRGGIPPVLTGATWAEDQPAPAGHWLMPEGTRIYRYDDTAEIQPPCIILFLEKDSEPYTATDNSLWRLHAAVDLIWPRDLTTLETQQLRMVLLNLFTADMIDPVPLGSRRPTERLSLPPSTGIPGIQTLAIRDALCTTQKVNAGHPEFNLTFTALAGGIMPT